MDRKCGQDDSALKDGSRVVATHSAAAVCLMKHNSDHPDVITDRWKQQQTQLKGSWASSAWHGHPHNQAGHGLLKWKKEVFDVVDCGPRQGWMRALEQRRGLVNGRDLITEGTGR